MARDHDRTWLVAGVAVETDVETGVVGPQRPCAHHHGVAPRPQPVGVGASGLAGDPLRRPVGGSRLAVEGGRELERHSRSAGTAVMEVAGVHRLDGVGKHPDVDREPGGSQPADPCPGDLRVRVDGTDHDAGNTGGDDGLGAWAGPAVMVARFEGHDEGAAGRRGAGSGERGGLGVRAAR